MSEVYTVEELRDLLIYVKHIREENEDLRAKLIAIDAMLKNEMAKNKGLKQMINQYIA
jgi:hypothetical protein